MTSKTSRHPDITTQWTSSPVVKETRLGRGSCIGEALRCRGLSSETTTIILAAWRRGTLKQYDSAWRKWMSWCMCRETSPFNSSEVTVLQYLEHLRSINKSYSVLNTHKSMLTQTLPFFGNKWCKDCFLIQKFMKGVFHSRPPVPRYQFVWDVTLVLNFLKSLNPLCNLSLKMLTFKVVALLALGNAPRAQTLISMDLSCMKKEGDVLICVFPNLLKTTKLGRPYVMKIEHFKDEKLCILHSLLFYIRVTKPLRKSSKLFISYVTYKAVTSSTIARWLKSVLDLSGINTDYFKAHSFRSASTSAAYAKGCRLKDILSTADWTSDKNFKKFYLRESVDSKSFVNSVFSK
ncbi:uncharacterized protein LOC127850683 [Dreissena polymorpha]|uniref:uncharacterized protein LOC127850683 n=1 Tax=Dreissena polymorpha TaxID=45954 RepID=UPI002264F960|nr:uncharacterized protein LOC127850683 [Dreissena polymorpha]XP_052239901.1 uncharacterized protein LOC127850683 [Dreissena polymorpha]